MMDFNSIKKYWNFDGYNRIKVVKSKQRTAQKSAKITSKTYDDYLDKISGFKCCCKEVCNCCCTYSLDGCCKKNTTQSYTTSATGCICFTGIMEARSGLGPHEGEGLGGVGYNNITGVSGGDPLTPFGSLHPKKTCEELMIESITYINNPIADFPNLQVTFSGDTWGGTAFKCIILTKDKKVIKLYRDQPGFSGTSPPNPQIWYTTNPTGGPFTTYFWKISPSLALTEGTWCVQISM